MKFDKSITLSFLLLVAIASLYRIMPGRPLGFAPQIAMALFSGSIVKDKKFAFLLPLASMLVSDIFYEVLFSLHITNIPGFYSGQVANYALFVLLTVIGFGVKKDNVWQIAGGSLLAACVYFVASNTVVWIGGGLDINNQPYPKNATGWMSAITAGIPFFKGSVEATLLFSAVLFGGYHLFTRRTVTNAAVA